MTVGGSGIDFVEGCVARTVFEEGKEARPCGEGEREDRGSEGEREREARREWVRKTWNEMISDLKL